MSSMQPPHLLILKRLLESSRRAQGALAEIRSKLPTTGSESMEIRGLFVLLISAMETMLIDTSAYYLRFFPEKFDFKDVKVGKDDVLSANLAVDLIEQQIQKNAVAQAYESFPSLLKTFMKTLGISEPALDTTLIDKIVEAKETRNVLIHNDLRVNRRYTQNARQLRREARDGRLPLSREYVEETCQNVERLIRELESRMSMKYASYTKIAACKRLWAYLFTSPVMPFEDYWAVKEGEDTIDAIKIGQYEGRLSMSERLFLSIWRAHFNGWNDSGGHMLMYSLDSRNKQKMLWFLATLIDFDVR